MTRIRLLCSAVPALLAAWLLASFSATPEPTLPGDPGGARPLGDSRTFAGHADSHRVGYAWVGPMPPLPTAGSRAAGVESTLLDFADPVALAPGPASAGF